MTEPLELSVIYQQGEDGFVLARIREVPAAMSQGRTREEARENVLDALRFTTTTASTPPSRPVAQPDLLHHNP
jgi:predicted RNase H-like HicB family nuclease